MNLVAGKNQIAQVEPEQHEKRWPSIENYGKPLVVKESIPLDNILLLGDVLKICKMGKSTYYRRMKDKDNPAPKPVGEHLTNSAWRRDEVEAYAEKIFAKFKPRP